MKVLLLSVILIVILHCHGGLSMMGAQGGDDQNQRNANLQWLVKKIRRDLLNKKMIEGGRQFAFVLLGDYALLNSVGSFQPNPVMVSAEQSTNPNIYDNLLVALPSSTKHIHSEITLLREVHPNLYKVYKKRYNHYPEFILLYSNVMPCKDCTTAIINFKDYLAKFDPAVKWFVGYQVGDSAKVPYVNTYTTRLDVNKLKNNGIDVFRVYFGQQPSRFNKKWKGRENSYSRQS